MMIRASILLFFLFLAWNTANAQEPLRTWTWENGKQSLKARLVRVENGRAVIKGSGKQMEIPVSRLSQKDREIVEQFIKDLAADADHRTKKKPKTIDLDNLPKADKELFTLVRSTKDWQRVAIDRRELVKIVKGLQDRDLDTRQLALAKLALVRPEPSAARDVLDAAKQARNHVDEDYYRKTFPIINTSWGNALRAASLLKSARNLRVLERMLLSTKLSERNAAMCALQATYQAEAAELLTRHYETLKGAPRTYLIQMGPVAAPAVAQMLTARDERSRRDACSILEEIGTSDQLGALHKMQLDGDGLVRIKATQAVKKIEESGR